MFETWVTAGGNLIAMRPDPDLAGLVGLTDARHRPLGRLPRRSTPPPATPGAGLVSETIQFHGTADRYDPGRRHRGRSRRCTRHASTATANPAVTLRERRAPTAGRRRPSPTTSPGRSSTRARATRPGPARSATASCRRSSGRTTCSSRTGSTSRKVADPAGRRAAAAARQPHPAREPRPDAAAAVLVLPARREGRRRDDRRRPRLAAAPPASSTGTSRRSPRGCDVDDWECVRGTSYMYPDTRRSAMPRRPPTRRRASRSRSTSTRTAATGHRAQPRRLLRRPARRLRVRLPERAGADDEPHALHHLERLGDASRRSSWPTASASTRTTTTGRPRGSRTDPATSPARACRCASPTSTAR